MKWDFRARYSWGMWPKNYIWNFPFNIFRLQVTKRRKDPFLQAPIKDDDEISLCFFTTKNGLSQKDFGVYKKSQSLLEFRLKCVLQIKHPTLVSMIWNPVTSSHILRAKWTQPRPAQNLFSNQSILEWPHNPDNLAGFNGRIWVVNTEKKKLVFKVQGLGWRAVKNNAFPPDM